MVKNMTVFKRTEQMLITSNMRIPAERLANQEFYVKDVIQHLLDNESKIVGFDPVNMDTMDVCINTLLEHQEDVIRFDRHSIRKAPKLRPRTFFHNSCRIIRVDLTEGSKVAYSNTQRMHKSVIEEGYEMVPKPWAHAVLVIKIERMTDSSCFASWTLVG